MNLTEFLLARIAEDEAVARAAALTVGWDGFGDQRIRSGQHWIESYHIVKRARDEGPTDHREVAQCAPLFGMDPAAHIARHDPARVLAECEAKRRIVEMFDVRRAARIWTAAGQYTLGFLALPYADHLDYDPSWRP